MAKILITGGSGLVGRAISELLLKNNQEVNWLSRESGEWNGIKKYKWNIESGEIDIKAFDDVETVIHLAGSGIADKKWTDQYKQEIIDSRVKSSDLLYKTIEKNGLPIKYLIGSSAIGYYGARTSEHLYTEIDAPYHDFLSKSCIEWEKSYDPFIKTGIKTSIIRIGIVLSQEGGAYAKMILPFKFGLGSSLASGKQYFPWIHIDDIAGIFNHILNTHYEGIYNAVASDLVNSEQFSKQLAKSLHRPFFMPKIPSFVLKMALGESAAMITEGVKVSNRKIIDAGYKFKFENLSNALRDLAN